MSGARARLEASAAAEAQADGVILRSVRTQEEYDECVRIQDETWGAGFNERVPSTILRVSQFLGGVTAAAFDAERGRMLGFVFGMTGLQDGHLVHWSDMLAVRPGARDRGLGRRLKLFQRSLVLPLGVTRMVWTFDPLVARNAHLNLNHLAAAVVDYVPDMYGADTGSALHVAVGTDRFIVAWDLTRDPPAAPRHHAVASPPPRALVVDPLDPSTPDGDDVYVAVPGDVQQIIAAAPELARAWRESTREAFLRYLARGYRVQGFQRTETHGYYRLTRA
jgi:predicted GNAT superfamily acetyltransferase